MKFSLVICLSAKTTWTILFNSLPLRLASDYAIPTPLRLTSPENLNQFADQ